MAIPRVECQAVIFDLDGTLLDTLDDIADSMNAALNKMGFSGHDTAAYKHLTGDGVRALAERSLPGPGKGEATVQACIQEFRSEYSNRWGAKTRPYPRIPELLDELVGRRIKLNVLSNKLDQFTRLAVRDFLPRWQFSIVWGARPDFPPKPDPAGAVSIARELGIDPAHFIYLGDTGVDMKTAVGAGMFPLGALWGFRDERELRKNGARAVLRAPGEFLRFLGKAG
jgi:phosphoglycolate phosphatase